MEGDSATEYSTALRVCKLASEGDPRGTVAAMRLTGMIDDTPAVEMRRPALDALVAGSSVCTDAAANVLYESALRGLTNTDVRQLAPQAGWLTRWTIARVANGAIAEKFEFPDARVVVPDYLPHTSKYAADAEFFAMRSGNYRLDGDLRGTALTVDGQEVEGQIALAEGMHQVRIVFRATEAAPRVRIVAAQHTDAEALAGLRVSPREKDYLETAMAAGPEAGGSVPAAATVNTPASLEAARRFAAENRHPEAIDELQRIIAQWPLDRDARRLLIAEFQRVGNDVLADRAAADFLTIAPNARNFRRMAAQGAAATRVSDTAEPFYQPYRRPAPPSETNYREAMVILLQDKVAITRPDGSVSLYVHRVTQVNTSEGAARFQPLSIPSGAQVLMSRVLNSDRTLAAAAKPGDVMDEEYVINYTGDGGMAGHPEAFQCVFNDFDAVLVDARFVVLSPAGDTPGYVIATGDAPESRVDISAGIRAQIWERFASDSGSLEPAIIRVVENENGWSIPPSVERRRILETIHPGPRPREA